MEFNSLPSYRPSNPPTLKGSEQRWIEDELRKLEQILVAITKAIEELRSLHAGP